VSRAGEFARGLPGGAKLLAFAVLCRCACAAQRLWCQYLYFFFVLVKRVK
jgi:hypothetical protein